MCPVDTIARRPCIKTTAACHPVTMHVFIHPSTHNIWDVCLGFGPNHDSRPRCCAWIDGQSSQARTGEPNAANCVWMDGCRRDSDGCRSCSLKIGFVLLCQGMQMLKDMYSPRCPQADYAATAYSWGICWQQWEIFTSLNGLMCLMRVCRDMRDLHLISAIW